METKSRHHFERSTIEIVLLRCCSIVWIVICSFAVGCSSEAEKPLKPIEKDVATNVALTLRQGERPADSATFQRMAPIDVSLDFDYDPDFDWDNVVLRLLREPTKKHPDGVVWTSWLGGRQKGTSIHRDSHHWDYESAWGPKVPGQKLGARPGEYELQISLDRVAETVDEKYAEQEDPALFQRPIWRQTITVVEEKTEPQTADANADDVKKR